MRSSGTKMAVILGVLAFTIDGESALAKASGSAEQTVHIQQLDPDLDFSSMEQRGVKVHPVERLEKPDPSELPKAAERDKFFSEAGLSEEIRNWDELDKDLLAVRARDPGGYPIDRLARLYPAIPKAKLEQLRRGASP